MGGTIHVGAWTGDEYVDSATRPLILVEPQAGPFAILQSRFGDDPGVELHCVACGDAPGEGTMHTAYPDHSSSLLQPATKERFGGAIKFARKIEVVRVATLDSIVRGRNDYSLLRIDTQGYELHVLRGAIDTLFRVGRVEIELHDPGVYPGAATLADVEPVLTAAGYQRISFDALGSDDLADVVYERRRKWRGRA